MLSHRAEDKRKLICAIENGNGTVCSILKQTILYGVAYHHADLTTEERKHIENAFREKILCVICCTSTLAAGVNLPAKRVILRSPYIGRDFITPSRYKQMVGRAGRAGISDSGESITMFEWKDRQRMVELLSAPMENVLSQLHKFVMKDLVLTSVSLRLVASVQDIENLVNRTLLSVQRERLGVDVKSLIVETVRELLEENLLQPVDPTVGMASLESNVLFEVLSSEMAVACLKSRIDKDEVILFWVNCWKLNEVVQSRTIWFNCTWWHLTSE